MSVGKVTLYVTLIGLSNQMSEKYSVNSHMTAITISPIHKAVFIHVCQ